ncbi:TetR/AcrR family transcriptional regulator [Streptomyces alfalfae]|uniref:TetR family transcriptional regulator n=1 Tax=Streptomyces alfalfae TaxID=1642299 RepID=A0A1P8TI20_9ACTN|nr:MULTISPECIES: TetR family transcriptional regulator [Streptomyces]AYA17677.1 TetR/AcrR family transcriptional regulator [Streptomyces fradiae]APY87271.1 TetR family transcriptional regulator [Streptomyces alfalfae]KUL55004.1 TetR family transcriptional regulator [Streptomyces sp. NRRL S-1521]QQC90428.1 TetR/AcrR family transcriptional regulator [Streptomyces alfalfae]QUI32902.1 TetR/AcrR family transcriptional regulator [Streptomyces alfalfae]
MGNREALLDAAKTCLRENGYDRTSVRDIATAAGVSMAAIGYHYGSREALLNKALFELLDAWGDSVGRALRPDADGSSKRHFEAMWESLIAEFTAHPDLWLASMELFMQARRNPELRDALAGGTAEGRRGMAAMLAGVPEDEVPEATLRSVGSVQLALMSGVMIQHLSDPAAAPTAAEVLEGLRGLADLAR